ncbi:MAG: YraN family protein [Oscillatoriales cyanobacterium]|nr:MAG: YraN family protein [Oscillatoriales cyanobacterium]
MGSNDSSELNSTRKRSSSVVPAASNSPQPTNSRDLGTLGENLVAQWLQQQGWEILHRQYHCRWGEIDIIALGRDEAAKQAKLWQTAEIFLSTRPDLANNSCRFDVALVRCEPSRQKTKQILPPTTANSQSALAGNYRLTLQEYIRSAFSD